MIRKRRLILCGLLLLLVASLTHGEAARIKNPSQSHQLFSPDGKYLAKVFATPEQTWVRILETREMTIVTQWQIPDFQPAIIEFSPRDSRKLLMADHARILVYQLSEDDRRLLFIQPETSNQELVDATFALNGDEVVWATRTSVIRSPLENRQDTKIAAIKAGQGHIRAFTPLSGGRYAVILNNNNQVLLYSEGNAIVPRELKGHRAPVAGVIRSLNGDLLSLDENQELVIWDLTAYRSQARLLLGDLENPSKVKGVGFDTARTRLLVKTEADPGETGRRFVLTDLKKGMVKPEADSLTITTLGKLYSTDSTIPGSSPKEDGQLRTMDTRRLPESFSAPESQNEEAPEKKPSFYELAKIEADNENFEAALEFIKKIPLNDPQFKQSRELRKGVIQRIETKNALTAAVEQYRTGNYQSAKILLENLLAKTPDNAEVKRYPKLATQRGSSNWELLLLAFLCMLLIATGVAVDFWKQHLELLVKGMAIFKNRKTEAQETATMFNLRKTFILKLDETRKLLKRAITLYKEGRWKDRWLTITSSINEIELRAKKDDKHLKSLIAQLTKLQEKILKLAPAARKSPVKESEPPHADNVESGSADSSETAQPKKQVPETPEKKTSPDYYEILGIGKHATEEEIKKAYRRKMRDYHPDKHNASDFEWVKKEADRMTKLIQEAYDALSDPAKRKHMTP